MTDIDLIVRGATVVRPAAPGGERGGAPAPMDVAVADGRIVAVEPEIPGPTRDEVDATGLHLLPGVVDVHVHFNEPGRADWEGFETGTRAAAAGGVTVAVDMPLNAHPPTIDAAAFDAKRAAGERSALIDFALWGGIVPGNLEELDELAARGVVGFKAFMSASGIDDFPRADDLTLYEAMRRAASLRLPVALHAESEEITAGLATRARAQGRTAMRDYLDSRPAIAEAEAISRAALLAEETHASVHVVHVSTGRGVALVAGARARGVDITCETCPHYLILTDEDAERLGAVAKCAPPLRPTREREALWRALADGTLPIVASDHSPAPAAMKGIETARAAMKEIGDRPAAMKRSGAAPAPTEGAERAAEDAFVAWGGISGVQTLLPLLLTDAGRLPFAVIAAATSAAPATRLRLAKGRLEPGADADLVLADLTDDHVLETRELHYRHRHSPFTGRMLRARIVRTLVRGATVYAGGRFADAPAGRLVTPDR